MQDITVKELKERLEKGEDLNVIDVREPHEYADYNIGAENIPLNLLTHKINQLEHLKNEEVIVHCKSGARSELAKKILKNNGFLKVRNLMGGMEAWKKIQ